MKTASDVIAILQVLPYEEVQKVKAFINSECDIKESISRGEQDIAAGRITRCETQKELDDYFESL